MKEGNEGRKGKKERTLRKEKKEMKEGGVSQLHNTCEIQHFIQKLVIQRGQRSHVAIRYFLKRTLFGRDRHKRARCRPTRFS